MSWHSSNVKANNKYTKDCECLFLSCHITVLVKMKCEDSDGGYIYILKLMFNILKLHRNHCWDFNNSYGWKMAQKLPVGGFN